ncbi:MAG: hypothetical protein K2X49_20310 [Acetobacteraceae bacterium]|nr:hypothetical protein [Acetobacteraceae bacterium]
MRRVVAELRAVVSALALLGILARALLPATAWAAPVPAVAPAVLCLPSGLPAPEGDTTPAEVRADGACPLCRLPDDAALPGAVRRPSAEVTWTSASRVSVPEAVAASHPPPRGPPPARAPPTA